MGDNLFLILLETLDSLPETVFDTVLCRVVKNADKITSHNLILRCPTLSTFAGRVGHESADGFASGINYSHAGLVDSVRSNGVEKSHALEDLDTLLAEVDLCSGRSQYR